MPKLQESQLADMKRMLQINCLHRGAPVAGKRWMVALDGSVSSRRAFNAVFSLMNKEKDQVYIATGTSLSLSLCLSASLCPSLAFALCLSSSLALPEMLECIVLIFLPHCSAR